MAAIISNESMIDLINRTMDEPASPTERYLIDKWCADVLAGQQTIREKKAMIWDKIGQHLLENDSLIDEFDNYIHYCTSQDGTILTINGPIISVGRDPDSDIVLSDRHASNFQAVIIIRSPYIVIMDSWSTNGMMVENMFDERGMLVIDPIFKAHLDDPIRLWLTDTTDMLLSDRENCIMLNPLPCLLCQIQCCQVKFNCGHSYLCLQCYEEIIAKDRDCCYHCGKVMSIADIGIYCDSGWKRKGVTGREVEDEFDPLREIRRMYSKCGR